jgi:hypothetical protein
MIFVSPVRCARKKKNAIPAPVPNSTVEDTMCSHLISGYQLLIGVCLAMGRHALADLSLDSPPSEFRFEFG